MESTIANQEDESDSALIKSSQESDRNDAKVEFCCDCDGIDHRAARAWKVIVEEFSDNGIEGGDV